MGESRFPLLMLQCSSPRAVILPLIPFMWTSEWVTCFLASFGSWEIGTMQVEHTESNFATLENVMPLTSIYSTQLLRSTCIICSVMLGRAVYFYTLINVLLGFAGYANRCIVAVHCLDEVRVYVRVPIFDFLAHQHCTHD